MFEKIIEKIQNRTNKKTMLVPLDAFINYDSSGKIVDKGSDLISAIIDYNPRALFIYNRWANNCVDEKKANMGGNGVVDMFKANHKCKIEVVKYIEGGYSKMYSTFIATGNIEIDLNILENVIIHAVSKSMFYPNLTFQPIFKDILILGDATEKRVAKTLGMKYLPSKKFIEVMIPCRQCEEKNFDCSKIVNYADLPIEAPCLISVRRRLKLAFKECKKEF